MKRQQEEPEPKPYQLIPFPQDQPQRSAPAGHDRAQAQSLSGWLDVTLETLRPLHVATGLVDFVRTSGGEQLALAQFTVTRSDPDDPQLLVTDAVLPGSSLKGALRSLVESLSPSCVLTVSKLTRALRPPRLNPCRGNKSLCPACRLFGTQDYQGQVSLADATVPEGHLAVIGTPLLWAPARSDGRGLPPRYTVRNEAKGRKLYEHRQVATGPDPRVVIREGAEISLRLSFTNLSRAELGLLLTALGQHPQHPFCFKLGGGKPVGLGSVEAHIEEVVLLSGGDALKRAGRLGGATERLADDKLKQRIGEWVAEAEKEQVLLPDKLKEVAETLHRDKLNQPAPSGLY